MKSPQSLAVIITALPIERTAILEHLREIREEPVLRGSIYRRGIFDDRSTDSWEVIVAEIGAGNSGASAEAERVIGHYKPQVALFVGVAGAVKDLKHGDVVASTKVYGYESGKDEMNGFKARPNAEWSAYDLEQRARFEAGEPAWRDRIKYVGGASNAILPDAKVAPIAAGEKVVASNRSQTYKIIRKHYSDAVAVEMEGYGFLHGVRMNHPTQGIVVRSMSDLVDDKTGSNDEIWQPIAACHAAAFAFQLLAKFQSPGTNPRTNHDSIPVQQINVGDISGSNTVTINQHQGYSLADIASILQGTGPDAMSYSQQLTLLSQNVAMIQRQFETVVGSLATSGQISLHEAVPDLSLPKSVIRHCPRPDSVGTLIQFINNRIWIALHGGPDVGKSQLALQITQYFNERVVWIRLHHTQPSADATNTIDAALTILAGRKCGSDRQDWTKIALATLGDNGLIVLDDIPRMSGNDPLTERLIQLCQCACEAQVHLLSTSQFELPTRLRQHLGDTAVVDRPAPPFSENEAKALLTVHGAPNSFLIADRVTRINHQAAGHPLLLTATAEYLASRGWRYTEQDVEALLRGDHTVRIMPEVIQRLTHTLGENPRELLYRLSLPIVSFTTREMIALARIEPTIDRPQERFNELLGAWIQRDTDTHFVVSPLARPLGQTELRRDTRRSCYLTLADAIVNGGPMGPFQSYCAIEYNLAANAPDRAIKIYVLTLIAAQEETQNTAILTIIDRWREQPLPAGLSVGDRLFARAYQLATFTNFNFDIAFILEDVDNLLKQATEKEGWAIVALVTQCFRTLHDRDPAILLGFIRRALELSVILGPDGQEIKFDSISLPDMLWMLVTELGNASILRQWFDAVESMPNFQMDAFWSSDLAKEATWLVPNKLYLTECEKQKTHQDWRAVLIVLQEMRARAESWKQPRLEAAITGIMIEVLSDGKRIDEIPPIAEHTLNRWPQEPDVQFKLRSAWGRAYAFEGRPADALKLIEQALAQTHSPYPQERIRCLLAANLCVAEGNLTYIEQARDFSRSAIRAPKTEVTRAFGEYAIASFHTKGGQQAAARAVYPAWSEAMKAFFSERFRHKIWRDQFPLYAHTTSYLQGMACYGQPPDITSDGKPFLIPRRGFFQKEYLPEREALYREGNEAGVYLMLRHYAAAVGERNDAQYWAKLTIEESRRTGALFIQVASGLDEISGLLIAGQFQKAVETGLIVGRGMVVQDAVGPKTRETFEGFGVDLVAEFRKLTENRRHLGDRFALISGVIPTAVEIARLSIQDNSSAISAAQQVASACRKLSNNPLGDVLMWSTVSDLFEYSFHDGVNITQIQSRIEAITGDGESQVVLRVIGFLLATSHATPDQVIVYHLNMIELLHRWFTRSELVYSQILTPYFVSYWLHAARTQSFAFGTPAIVVPAIESAANAPESQRIHAILSAALLGFRTRSGHDILQRLREMNSQLHAQELD